MSDLKITLVNDSPGEALLRRVLLEFLRQYDLSPWSWVKDIRIERDLKPMGQCFRENGEFVIRLRSGRAEQLDPEMELDLTRFSFLLSTYIHEQLHAYLDLNDAQVQWAVAELRTLYPEVPVGGTEGARSEFSTYLHLLLCTLELDSLEKLLGEEKARALMDNRPFYQFIYRSVLRDTDALRGLLHRHGLDLPFLRSRP